MATGGERNAVCRFSATRRPKNSGSMLNLASSGMKIGMKITMISVHSSGQPSRKMITCARIMNWMGVRPSDSTQRSMISWPPSSANAAEKIEEPTKSQHTIAEVFAVRKTDSFTVGHRFTCRQATTHHVANASIEIQPTQSGGREVTTTAYNRINQTTATKKTAHRGNHAFSTCVRRGFGSAYQRYTAASTNP